MYSISFLPILWIGVVYATHFLGFHPNTISLLVRGPAFLVLLAPGIDALLRLREAKDNGLDKR
jgi:hypothetical protein